MKRGFKGIAHEISQGLVSEIAARRVADNSPTAGVVQVLLQQLADEAVRQAEEDASEVALLEALETRLQRLETRLEKLAAANGDQDDDEDEVEARDSSFPNLKYAKPKYKDVESLLNYIESDDDKGGLKLVIMNFND